MTAFASCGACRDAGFGEPAAGANDDGTARLRSPATMQGQRPARRFRLPSQMPSSARDTLCETLSLGVPNEAVRVVVGDIGGGFGMKGGLYPEEIVVAYATRQNAMAARSSGSPTRISTSSYRRRMAAMLNPMRNWRWMPRRQGARAIASARSPMLAPTAVRWGSSFS